MSNLVDTALHKLFFYYFLLFLSGLALLVDKRPANGISVELVMPFHNLLYEISKRHATGVTSFGKPNRTALFSWNLAVPHTEIL